MQTPILSIIVPIYKSEPYLQECIDSILNQTFRNFELILIDDGSPDNSGKICDYAQQKDARIRVHHQSNQGVTRARAYGASIANGEFICFVDSDDTLITNALQILTDAITEETDIILGDVIPAYYSTSAQYISINEYRTKCTVMNGVHPGPYAKLFRRTLIDEEIFNIPREIRVGEDAIMNIRIAYRVKGKIYQTGKAIYNIRNNAMSVTHTLAPTPEMAMLMAKYRLTSFPAEDLQQHIEAGLYKSLISHWLNALHHTPKLPASVLEYRQFLLSIKKESGYKFNVYSYLLFHSPNQFCLELLVNACKLVKWLKSKCH